MPPKIQKKRLRGGSNGNDDTASVAAADDSASVQAETEDINDEDAASRASKRHQVSSPSPSPVAVDNDEPAPMDTTAEVAETKVVESAVVDAGVEAAIAADDFSTEQDHQTKFPDPNEFMRTNHPLYWRHVLDKIEFQVTEFGKGANKTHKINAVVKKGVGIAGKPEYKQARWISPFAYVSNAMVFPFGNRQVDFSYVKAGKFGERVHPYNKFNELHRSASLSAEPWFPGAPVSAEYPAEYQEMADYIDALAQVQHRFILFMITDPTARAIKAVNDLYVPALEAARNEKKQPLETLAALVKAGKVKPDEETARSIEEFNKNPNVTVTPEEILKAWPAKEMFFRSKPKADSTPAVAGATGADGSAATAPVQTQSVAVPATSAAAAAAESSIIMPRQLNVDNYVFQQEKPDFANKKKLELSPEVNNNASLRYYHNFLEFAKKHGYILTPFTFKDAQNRTIDLEHGFLDFGDVAATDTVLDCIPNSKDKSSIALRLGGVIHYMARNRCNELLGRQFQSRNATMSENVDFPALPGTLGMFDQDAQERAERLLRKQQKDQQSQPPLEGPPSYSSASA